MAKGNVLKLRCPHCKSRATIIRTDPDATCAILTGRCDNPACAAEFRAAISYLDELRPPVRPPDLGQLSFLEVARG